MVNPRTNKKSRTLHRGPRIRYYRCCTLILTAAAGRPGSFRGEFVVVLHGFRGDSDDLFGRLVDPDADPADVLQRRGDAGAMSAEAFGPSDRAVTIAAISKVLDQRYVLPEMVPVMVDRLDARLCRLGVTTSPIPSCSLSWSVLTCEWPGMTRI